MPTIRWRDRRYEVQRRGSRVQVADPPAQLNVERVGEGAYRVVDGDEKLTAYVYGSGEQRWVFLRGDVFELEMSVETRPARQAAATHETLSAPMPATVVRILKQSGDVVRKGETLVVLEAMKMELPIRAPRDGHVTAIR